MSFPRNPYNPHGIEALADEYVRGVAAGAAICHLHGPYFLDEKIRPDGTKLSDLDLPGWQRLKDSITNRCTPIIQYGIANGRFPQRVESMKQHPDMMSICFNAHDESFQPDPDYPPVELYGIHDRGELENYCRYTKQYGVKPEVESFHYGAIWNAQRFIRMGLLETPVWTTLFLGWPRGLGASPLRAGQERDVAPDAVACSNAAFSFWRTRPRGHGRQPVSRYQRDTGAE